MWIVYEYVCKYAKQMCYNLYYIVPRKTSVESLQIPILSTSWCAKSLSTERASVNRPSGYWVRSTELDPFMLINVQTLAAASICSSISALYEKGSRRIVRMVQR